VRTAEKGVGGTVAMCRGGFNVIRDIRQHTTLRNGLDVASLGSCKISYDGLPQFWRVMMTLGR
jgi:hypothetical protein